MPVGWLREMLTVGKAGFIIRESDLGVHKPDQN
jgi:hypothetical protein